MREHIPNKRIVYLDESYIHHHYNRHKDYLIDPEEKRRVEVRKQFKGDRYCFIGAIISSDPTVPPDRRGEQEKAHFLKETLHIFKGSTKKNVRTKRKRRKTSSEEFDDGNNGEDDSTDKILSGPRKRKYFGKDLIDRNETVDYHGMFHHDYFIEWTDELLKTLKERKFENCVIVMDNASYHKRVSDDIPRATWRKEDLLKYCTCNGIDTVKKEMLKAHIWQILSESFPAVLNPKSVVQEIIEAAGHQLIFTPPHFSDLQPIEMVWACVKGEVGRAYDKDTTFKMVKGRLKEAFENLSSSTVEGCIRKSVEKLNDFATMASVTEEDLTQCDCDDLIKSPDEHSIGTSDEEDMGEVGVEGNDEQELDNEPGSVPGTSMCVGAVCSLEEVRVNHHPG